MANNKPSHRLLMKSKSTGAYTVVGVGWATKTGNGVSIFLNPGCVLHWRDAGDCILTLFPADQVPADGGSPVVDPSGAT